MKQLKKQVALAVAAAAVALGAHAAPAVLDTGTVQMGVGDTGGLGQGIGTGFSGPTGDAITPGCLCEGWGAAGGGLSGWTDGASGDSGIVTATLTTTVASGPGLAAASVVTLTNGLQVTHTYSSAAGGTLFKVAIELLNTTGGALTDVRYARTLDWDVTPGFFGNNYTTVYGGTPAGPGGKVLTTSTDPFAPADPLTFRGQEQDTNVVDSIGDKGGFFVFGFGDLAAGASTTFDTYIGADPTVAGLLAALASVGVEAYSYTTGSTPDGGTFSPAYGYGFAGLGLPPIGTVSEPGTLALAGLALVGMTGLLRRRRR